MAESEKPPQEVDMRYYNDLMNCVPCESASVPLILHSILEQVCMLPVDEHTNNTNTTPIHLSLPTVLKAISL